MTIFCKLFAGFLFFDTVYVLIEKASGKKFGIEWRIWLSVQFVIAEYLITKAAT